MGGVHEVTNVEVTVLNLGLEVVDIRQEGVDNCDESPSSACFRVHKGANTLTIGPTNSVE